MRIREGGFVIQNCTIAAHGENNRLANTTWAAAAPYKEEYVYVQKDGANVRQRG